MKTILLLLSETLLEEHVGVKRVAIFYASELRLKGIKVDLGFFKNSLFYKVTSSQIETDFYSYKSTARLDKIKHSELVDPGKYDYVLISCPWLIKDEFPPLRNSIGIILDLIPNLIALNIVKFPGKYFDCFQFAAEHSKGFDYFAKYSKFILSISHSTTRDFLNWSRNIDLKNRTRTILPFKRATGSLTESRSKKNILLVNSIDPRKNLYLACEVLAKVGEKHDLKVTFVGKARANEKYISDSFGLLKKNSISYEWIRDCSDSFLVELYKRSTCLFFPSIYEGLGLPILEAQNFHCPVVTSKGSSCGEIAFFSELLADHNDIQRFYDILDRLLTEEHKFDFESQWRTLMMKYNDLSGIF